MSGRQIIALLGRRDSPTDGVEDYCAELGRALEARGLAWKAMRVPWAERGWLEGLRWLWRQSRHWEGKWTLVQYTALNWSRRGFSAGLLAVLLLLKWRKTKVAVVFHDALPYPGDRLIDRFRRLFQLAVMRMACAWARRPILTVSLDRVPWLGSMASKAVFIPVGANMPHLEREACSETPPKTEKTVAVFGVTGGRHMLREVHDIAFAVTQAARQWPHLRLAVLGRGSDEAKEHLVPAFEGMDVKLSVLGVLPAAEVSHHLSRSDVLLFVRGGVSSRRSSAIAGIACRLPVVGYKGVETAPPITEAGVVLVPHGDQSALAEALVRVLMDEVYASELRRQSCAAWRRYFSWEAIGERYVEVLEPAADVRARHEMALM